jgi:hypothetical protein
MGRAMTREITPCQPPPLGKVGFRPNRYNEISPSILTLAKQSKPNFGCCSVTLSRYLHLVKDIIQ